MLGGGIGIQGKAQCDACSACSVCSARSNVERSKLAEVGSEAGEPTITLEGGQYLGYLDSVIPGWTKRCAV